MLSLTLALPLALGLAAPAAHAPGSHLWVVHEIFSSADGSVQFLELHECCGSTIETNLTGKSVTSDATGNTFTFTENLTGNTANRYLLLATAAFAALPGAPTPDYVIPDGFFDPTGDTLRWHVYPNAVLSFGPGELPQDGISSLLQSGATGPNTPTNFAGQSGTVSLGVAVPALPVGGLAVALLASALTGALVLRRRSRS